MATLRLGASDLPEKEYTTAPDGDYELIVTKSELKNIKDNKGEMIELECSIIGPTYEGVTVKKYIMIFYPGSDTAERIGRENLRALISNSNQDLLSKDSLDDSDLVGIVFFAGLATEENEYKGKKYKKNVIKYFINRDSSELPKASKKKSTVPSAKSYDDDDIPF
jgi:hypothetical protein